MTSTRLASSGFSENKGLKHGLGYYCPVINSVLRGREDTRVWYRETMFSQMVSYDFPLHGLLHEYFLYLVSAPRNPEGIANLKKAICVVRSDSIIGVTL